MLCIAPNYWPIDMDPTGHAKTNAALEKKHGPLAGHDATVEEEVTGHWCPKCQKLCSLSFNTYYREREILYTEA